MSGERFVRLIEELVDLKVQYHLANQLKVPSELSSVVARKRENDRRRTEEIRAELISALTE